MKCTAKKHTVIIRVLREGLLGHRVARAGARAPAVGACVPSAPVLVLVLPASDAAVIRQRLVLRRGAQRVVRQHAAIRPRGPGPLLLLLLLLLQVELLRRSFLRSKDGRNFLIEKST